MDEARILLGVRCLANPVGVPSRLLRRGKTAA